MSGSETEKDAASSGPSNVCVVETVDANGSIVDRTAFATEEAAAAHASHMRSKGYKVTQSPLAPMPEA